MQNYLFPILMRYFVEANSIEGRMHAISVIVPDWKTHWLQANPNGFRFQESGTAYRDLSKNPKVDNLEMPDVHYEITINNMDDEMENLVSRECGLAIAQAYETFESFFLNILTEYLLHSPHKLVEVGLIHAELVLLREEVERLVRKASGTNDKGLIRMVRKASAHFKKHESSNYLEVNIVHWFDLLSMIRHTMVHNRQAVSNRFLLYLEKNKVNASYELFNRQFQRKVMDDKVCLLLKADTTHDIFSWLNSFAHLIFTSLSTEARLPLEVPGYIPRRLATDPF
jgi:hypothetical protein